jgi:uncharacterized membrane protein
MTAPRKPASSGDGMHRLARPFAALFAPRAGVFALVILAAMLVIGFGVEAAVTGGAGLSKYPEVLGGYEILPAIALAAAILAAWILRWVLGASGPFYERAAGDLIEEDDGDA